MPNLIPYYIAEQYRRQRSSGSLTGATMFVDIAGFTAMTQRLMANGREGAEVLSHIINAVFTPAIGRIGARGGFVASFAGDAFTAVFPRTAGVCDNALAAAQEIRDAFAVIGRQQTRFGQFELSVKIGLSHGRVQWGIIRNPLQHAHFFRGQAIDGAARAEHQCAAGEIVVDSTFKRRLAVKTNFAPRAKGFFLAVPGVIRCNAVRQRHTIPLSVQRAFAPASILDLKSPGEFRDVVICFISFSERTDYRRDLPAMIDLAHRYGGYLNKIDFGDKGGIMLALFGAPVGREKLESRACDFALAATKLKTPVRAGLTMGTVFAGFVGSAKRSEYTALGREVNLAARLAMSAKWREVRVDAAIHHKVHSQYHTTPLGAQLFKGFSAAVEAFSLRPARIQSDGAHLAGKLVGRTAEMARLTEFLSPIDSGKFAGIIYIDGPAGIGKSRLVAECRATLEMKGHRWLHLPCDEILRKGFNPVIHFLKREFGQSDGLRPAKSLIAFERSYDRMVARTRDREVKQELIRARPFIGAMLGLAWKGSLCEQLDAKGRYQNTLYGLKALVKALAAERPVVIELEDGHWVDHDTIGWLELLTRNVDGLPLAIVTACRNTDDGAPFRLALPGVSQHTVALEAFDQEQAKTFAESLFTSRLSQERPAVPQPTLDLIWRHAEGNPFYIEQMVLYLLENSLLDDTLLPVAADLDIPQSINQVIVSRIDKLSSELKQVIKTASVLGREFAVGLLAAMLKPGSISHRLHVGEHEHIWDSVSELKYIFHHALIRESAYQMQLVEQRRGLHALAARTIESLYADSLAQHYPDLAEHYHRAGIAGKAREFLGKAADQARESYKNVRAMELYQQQLRYLDQPADQLLVRARIADLMHLLGRYDQEEPILRSDLELARAAGDLRMQASLCCRLADVLLVRYAYDEIEPLAVEARKLAEANGYRRTLMIALHHLASIYYSRQEFERGHQSLKDTLAIADEIGDHHMAAQTVFGLRGEFIADSTIIPRLKGYLQQAERLGDARQTATVLFYLGDIYIRLRKTAEALACNQRMLELVEKTGDRQGMCYAVGDRGIIHLDLGEFDQAIECFQRKLAIAREMGDQYNIYEALENMAHAHRCLGQYDEALQCIDQAILLCRTYNILQNLAHVLKAKANMLVELGQPAEAAALLDESFPLAEQTKQANVVYEVKRLRAKIAAAEDRASGIMMLQKLLQEYPDDEQAAELTYEIFLLTKDDRHRETAVSLYRTLYQSRPVFSYKDKLQKLSAWP